MERNKIETYKGILYILLLIYCCFEISNNFNEIRNITENALPSKNLENTLNKGYDINLYNLNYDTKDYNNEILQFTYYDFNYLMYKIIEIIIYFNIVFMLLIFLSQNSEGVLNLIKNE